MFDFPITYICNRKLEHIQLSAISTARRLAGRVESAVAETECGRKRTLHRSRELIKRVLQESIERVCMAIFIPTMWSGIVDIDAGMKDRIVLTHRIYHDLARLFADGCDIVDIALDNHSIVHR